jgi:hypothetical protein
MLKTTDDGITLNTALATHTYQIRKLRRRGNSAKSV